MNSNTTDIIEYLIEVDRTFKTKFIESMSESTVTEIKRLCFEVDYYLHFGRRLPTYKKRTTETPDECGPPAMKYRKIAC